MNTIIKLKCYKICQSFKHYRFTLNQNAIFDGNLKMFPDIKWIFIQSKVNPNIFNLQFMLIAFEKDEKRYYINPMQKGKYAIMVPNDGLEYDLVQIETYAVLGSYFDGVNYKVFSFLENVFPTDVYEYDDFINIVKGINEEITNYLYKTGNYRIDTENSINCVEDNSEFEMLSEDTTKMLIKKVHREYMDNKVYNVNHND